MFVQGLSLSEARRGAKSVCGRSQITGRQQGGGRAPSSAISDQCQSNSSQCFCAVGSKSARFSMLTTRLSQGGT
ncbi:hypothetical protein PMAYCL1PPCAC_31976, partial [Pristionchus mayeri]